MDELKPCPFCGNEVELIPAYFSDCCCVNPPSIICAKCHQTYKGFDIMQSGKSEAENEEFSTNLFVKCWNSRPAEDEKDKEIQRLKAIIDELTKPRTDGIKRAVQSARIEIALDNAKKESEVAK